MKTLTEFLWTESVEDIKGHRFFINHPTASIVNLLPRTSNDMLRFAIYPSERLFVFWDGADIWHGDLGRFLHLDPQYRAIFGQQDGQIVTGFLGLEKGKLVTFVYRKRYTDFMANKNDYDPKGWAESILKRLKNISTDFVLGDGESLEHFEKRVGGHSHDTRL